MTKHTIQSSLAIGFFLTGIIFATTTAHGEDDIRSILGAIEDRYNITCLYDRPPNKLMQAIRFNLADRSDYEVMYQYSLLFAEEFRKYPLEFVSNTKLNSVFLVKDLAVNGQARTAVPDYDNEVLLLDFAAAAYAAQYRRHVIHHEYYHMIEEQINGDAYWKDPVWAGFNPPGFRYGSGGVNARGQDGASTLNHPHAGFVSLYAMSSLEEDKAEVYACLLIDTEREAMNEWAKTDHILASKITYMSEFIARLGSSVNANHAVPTSPMLTGVSLKHFQSVAADLVPGRQIKKTLDWLEVQSKGDGETAAEAAAILASVRSWVSVSFDNAVEISEYRPAEAVIILNTLADTVRGLQEATRIEELRTGLLIDKNIRYLTELRTEYDNLEKTIAHRSSDANLRMRCNALKKRLELYKNRPDMSASVIEEADELLSRLQLIMPGNERK